ANDHGIESGCDSEKMTCAVGIFIPVKRPQLGLGGQFSIHPQAVADVPGLEVMFGAAVNFDTITGRQQHQSAAASFTYHSYAPRMPSGSLARCNFRRV